MYKEIKDYQTIFEFTKSKTLLGASGKPVSRQYIYDLVKEEEKNPGTTGLDVLCVGGNNYFVKKSIKD